jgi:hypothetical protein
MSFGSVAPTEPPTCRSLIGRTMPKRSTVMLRAPCPPAPPRDGPPPRVPPNRWLLLTPHGIIEGRHVRRQGGFYLDAAQQSHNRWATASKHLTPSVA